MKNLFYLLMFFFITFSFNSCTSENNEIGIEKKSLFKNEKINEFLTNYYDVDYAIGESISLDSQDVKIVSLTSSYQNDPIGYVFTELNSGKFISFLDVDVESQKSTMFDFINDKEFINDDFFKSNNLNKEQSFNLVSEIERGNMSNTKKFWGTSCGPVWSIGGNSYQTCCYYVFWVNTGCSIVGVQ